MERYPYRLRKWEKKLFFWLDNIAILAILLFLSGYMVYHNTPEESNFKGMLVLFFICMLPKTLHQMIYGMMGWIKSIFSVQNTWKERITAFFISMFLIGILFYVLVLPLL